MKKRRTPQGQSETIFKLQRVIVKSGITAKRVLTEYGCLGVVKGCLAESQAVDVV